MYTVDIKKYPTWCCINRDIHRKIVWVMFVDTMVVPGCCYMSWYSKQNRKWTSLETGHEISLEMVWVTGQTWGCIVIALTLRSQCQCIFVSMRERSLLLTSQILWGMWWVNAMWTTGMHKEFTSHTMPTDKISNPRSWYPRSMTAFVSYFSCDQTAL